MRLNALCRLMACSLSLCASVWVMLARPAHAYVCAQANGGSASLAWFTRNVPYIYNRAGSTKVGTAEAQAAINRAFGTWANLTVRAGLNCPGAMTNMTFQLQPEGTEQTFIGYNYLAPEINRNVIIFRDQTWPYGSGDGDVVARTTLTYNAVTGQILDADMEFNSANFNFTTGDTNVGTDLQNVATHEVGHFLGFAHSLDTIAVMGPLTLTGETLRRALSCDDRAVMAFRYPNSSPEVGYCRPANALCGFCGEPTPLPFTPTISVKASDDGRGGGCQNTGPSSPWLAIGAVALLLQRRRDRKIPVA